MATGTRTSLGAPPTADVGTRPLRVAIVLPTPVPYREPLFAALHERPELDLRVIYQSSGQPSWDVPGDWFARGHPYPAVHLRSWQRSRPGRSPITWPRGLTRALSVADPDCVVASEYGPASLRALWWCRRRRRAYAVLTECTPQIDAMLSPAQLRVHRWVSRHADALIPVSSAAAGRLASFGVPAERITMALQAADLDPVRAAAEVRNEPRRPLTVLSVGRLVPDKNFAALIEAVARVPDEVALQIAGTGFLEGELRGQAECLGAPVRFHGHVPPGDLPRLYNAADVYALVSTYEPFGVSVREAAAAGLPIVCSQVAGAAGDVAVAGRNAILVDPRSVAEIAAAVARLASEPELRRDMAEQSRLVDAETAGREVDAFASAVLSATRPR